MPLEVKLKTLTAEHAEEKVIVVTTSVVRSLERRTTKVVTTSCYASVISVLSAVNSTRGSR